MKITLYYANCVGVQSNTIYPNRAEVATLDDFIEVARHDYVCAKYKNNHRSREDFEESNCIAGDCDNDHSDDPDEWVTPKKVSELLPNVPFFVQYSLHHNLPKGGKSARPRFHIVFPISTITQEAQYSNLKQRLYELMPFLDDNALDSARFFYGTQEPDTELYAGARLIDQYLTDYDAFMAGGASGFDAIGEGRRNSAMSHIAGKLVKRYGDTHEARMAFLQAAERCNPPLERDELKSIWNSARKFGKRIEQQEGYVKPEVYNQPSDWEEPVPFMDFDLPLFPVDALPKPIADYVTAVATSTQTPVDMAATSAIAVMSVCMQGKFKIQAKADWSEPVNTYVLDVMNPSERKSAVQNAMVRPINTYEAEKNAENTPLIEASRSQKRVLEKRQRAIEDLVVKGKADADDIRKIAEEITGFREVKPLKLYVDDITTEKLTSVLAENDGCAAILSTEGGIFDTLSGAYSRTVNIDVMLKGYSGDSIRVDRIGRNSESILNPTLTVLLMVQPSVLSGLMRNPTFRGRGLTARFLYCIPASGVGKRSYYSPAVPEEVYRNYDRCIRNMLEDDKPKSPERITLSKGAQDRIAEFAEALEPELVGQYEDISDWAGKLVGNIHRIAALLCRAEAFRSHDFLDDPEPLCVSEETMVNAIRIGKYFVEHAKAAYLLMGGDNVTASAKRVLAVIKEKGLKEFNRRDILRCCRSFKSSDDVQRVLDQLVEYGYISEKPGEPYFGRGRPPLQKYCVNPNV